MQVKQQVSDSLKYPRAAVDELQCGVVPRSKLTTQDGLVSDAGHCAVAKGFRAAN